MKIKKKLFKIKVHIKIKINTKLVETYNNIISMLPANKKLCSPPLNNIFNFANILKPTNFIEETTVHSQ